MPPPTKRPPRRTKKLEVQLSPQDLDEALRRARQETPDPVKDSSGMKQLRAVVRAFLKLWSAREMDVDPEVVAEERRRAKKRKLKQTKSTPKPPDE